MSLSTVIAFLNKWEIQFLISTSMVLQIFLIFTGNRRKYSADVKLQLFVWLAYSSADWMATFSLGVLSSRAGCLENNSIDPRFAISTFFVPFFLLHLGGPDTITSYSLEDNELWMRHSLTLLGQVGVAIYVIHRGWTKTGINFLAIPMFIPGIIKICERIWALRSASSENFKSSMLRCPDPGPNYSRYMEGYCSKKDEGFNVESQRAPVVVDLSSIDPEIDETEEAEEAIDINNAYIFFDTFKQLFADLILSFQDIKNSQSFFRSRSYRKAFQVIEIELGFMYDVFYTKAFKFYSLKSGILRFIISFSSTSIVLLLFVIIINKKAYKTADQAVTYAVVSGALGLELYALLILLNSDWTMLWLYKHKNDVVDLLYKAILIPLGRRKRWSNTMAQYNLIKLCVKARPAMCGVIQKVYGLLEKHRYQDSENVSETLKELIFEQLKKKSEKALDFKACKELCAYRGDQVLQNEECLTNVGKEILDTLNESVAVEFDQSILMWHIATNLCYNMTHTVDQTTTPNVVQATAQSTTQIRTRNSVEDSNCEASKLLSNYMLYLLVMRPVMLPNGIEQIRFQDTCAETTEFLEERNYSDEIQACTKLLEVCTEVPPSEVKGDRSKSVLFDGCRLAKSLQCLETKTMWKLISHVWVEMLCYAASHCQSNHHAQQLTQGGELLTHVWLLMAHLGITEQFQISKGHAKAELIVN